MKKMAIAVIAAVSGLKVVAGAVEARPIALDIRTEAGAGELSDKAAAISKALSAGDSAGAEQLLADLYSGGSRGDDAGPVRAATCCCHPISAPAVVVSGMAVTTPVPAAPIAAAPGEPFANDPVMQYLKAEEAKKDEADAKAREKEEEAVENAKRQKAFNWGVTLMTIALLLLLL